MVGAFLRGRERAIFVDGRVFTVLNRFGVILFTLSLPLVAQAFDYSGDLIQRYTPYVGWSAQSDWGRFETGEVERWWRSPKEIRNIAEEPGLPLSGLHLALDPGHIGGEWAEIEGRNFKINSEDFPVREGELVLEVARLVQIELVRMGAKVSLLRNGNFPLNPRSPEAYFSVASERIGPPEEVSWAALFDYGLELRSSMNRMSAVSGELLERARLVNEEIKPDLLISLHINAAPWPLDEDGREKLALVDSNHTHVLIFGCLSEAELSVPLQKKQLIVKMINGSAGIERELGQALGLSLGEATGLPPSKYSGRNAVQLDGCTPYLWARNLMLLRSVQCPVVLLEPYIANSRWTYPRIQAALKTRHDGQVPAEDDILLEYAAGVVEGLLSVYASER